MSNKLKLPSAWEMGFQHGSVRAAVWDELCAAYAEGRQLCTTEMRDKGVLPSDLVYGEEGRGYHPTSYFTPIKNEINRRMKDRGVPLTIIRGRKTAHFAIVPV